MPCALPLPRTAQPSLWRFAPVVRTGSEAPQGASAAGMLPGPYLLLANGCTRSRHPNAHEHYGERSWRHLSTRPHYLPHRRSRSTASQSLSLGFALLTHRIESHSTAMLETWL